MSKLTHFLGTLPTAAIVGLVVVLVVQLALQIAALIDLFRRRRVLGGRKWVWVLIIMLGNLVGAIVYLAVGRLTEDVVVDFGGGDGSARKKALDRLYGDRDR